MDKDNRAPIFTSKDESVAYNKKYGKKTSFNFDGVSDEFLDRDSLFSEYSLEDKQKMVQKVKDLQTSGKLYKSDAGYYTDDSDMMNNDLFRYTLNKLEKAPTTIKEQDAAGTPDEITTEVVKDENGNTELEVTPGETADTPQGEPQEITLDVLQKQFGSFWDEQDDLDKARLGLLTTDIVSAIAGYIPGAHIGSAAVGALSTLGYAAADYMDEDVGFWDATGNLAMGLGLDALSLVGGKAGKTAKSVSNLAPLMTKMKPMLGTALKAYGIYGGVNAIEKTKLEELSTKGIEDWEMEDYQNAAAALQFMLSGTKAVGRSMNARVAKGNSTNINPITKEKRGLIGRGKAKVVQGAQKLQGTYSKHEQKAYNKAENVASHALEKPSNMDYQRVNSKIKEQQQLIPKTKKQWENSLDKKNKAKAVAGEKMDDLQSSINQYRHVKNVPARPQPPLAAAKAGPVVHKAPAIPQKAPEGPVSGTLGPKPRPAQQGLVRLPENVSKDARQKVQQNLVKKNKAQKKVAEASTEIDKSKKEYDKNQRTLDKRKRQKEKYDNKMKRTPKRTLKKMEAETKANISKRQKSLDIAKERQKNLEVELGKTKGKAAQEGIKKKLKKAENAVKAQTKNLNAYKKKAKSDYDKESSKKLKNVYRLPRDFTIDKVLPFMNKGASKVGGAYTGHDLRHMKNVYRAEDSRIGELKSDTGDAWERHAAWEREQQEKYLKQMKQKQQKKKYGGKLEPKKIKKFYGGGWFDRLSNYISDAFSTAHANNNTNSTFNNSRRHYGNTYNPYTQTGYKTKASASDRVLSEEDKKYLDMGKSLNLGGDGTYGKTPKDYIPAPYEEKQFLEAYKNKYGVDMTQDLLNEELLKKRVAEITGITETDAEKEAELVKKASQIKEDTFREYEEGIQSDLDLLHESTGGDVDMNNLESGLEDITAFEEEEEGDPIELIKLDPLKGRRNKTTFSDVASNLGSVFNPSDIYNLTRLMKKPKSYTAYSTPMQAVGLNQEVVSSMPGMQEMKDQVSKPTYNVKSSDLATKATLEKRNQDATNQSLNQLNLQNAQYTDASKQRNQQVQQKNKANSQQIANINAQAATQTAMQNAQMQAQQDMLLEARKDKILGSLGNRSQLFGQQMASDRAENKYLDVKDNYNNYQDFIQDTYQGYLDSGEFDNFKTDAEKKAEILKVQDKVYSDLYGYDPANFANDIKDTGRLFSKRNRLVKRNPYYY